MKVVVASRNRGKLREIVPLLAGLDFDLITIDEIAPGCELREDGDTFEANALAKARQAAQATGLPAIADDSGLEVAALDGAPGVYSARYAGPTFRRQPQQREAPGGAARRPAAAAAGAVSLCSRLRRPAPRRRAHLQRGLRR